MKNKLSIIATSLALLVLASCNSSINISKRRYNKGYYVSVSDTKKATTETTASRLEESKKIEALAISQNLFSKQIETITTENTPLVASAEKLGTTSNKVEKSKALAYTAIANKAIQQAPAKKMSIVQKAVQTKLAKSIWQKLADDMKVIIIILCFFIPPLAVYLHQDDITKDFWINLILTCLCGIPGIIHALIVVTR